MKANKTHILYSGPVCGINKKLIFVRGKIRNSSEYNLFIDSFRYAAQSQIKDKNNEYNTLSSHFVKINTKLKYALKIRVSESFKHDIDAFIKPIMDALEGVLYENDRQIVKVSAKKTRLPKGTIKCILKIVKQC